ncbi:MAG: hypothetical protein QW291_08580 [Thermofilaceae archaeon]
MKYVGFLFLIYCILLLAALSLAEPMNVQATHLLTESKVVHAAVVGTRLLVTYSNGSLIAYELPRLANARKLLTFNEVEIAGLGPLDENIAVLVFRNGTVIALNVEDGARLWNAQLAESYSIKSTAVNGRWIAATVKYNLGGYEADRILVFDCLQRAVVYKIDKNGDSRLVYAFNIKISGSLLLITGIDTTCSLCKMTDTYVLVYNLSQLRRIFAVRPGACLSDLVGNTLVIVKINNGLGYYYDLEEGLEVKFEVNGVIADVRVYSKCGYVLSQNDSGVFLSKIEGGKIHAVRKYDEGSRIFFVGKIPAVISESSIYLDESKIPVRTLLPLQNSMLLEYGDGVVLIYGGNFIYSIYSVKEPSIIIATEPGTLIEIPKLRVESFTNSSGLAVLNLPPGLYNISFTKEGYKRNYTLVEIDPNKVMKINVKLTFTEPNYCPVFLKVVDDNTKQPLLHTLNVTLINGFASPVTKQLQPKEGLLELYLACQEEYAIFVSAEGYIEWKGEIHAGVNGSIITLSLKKADQMSPVITQPLYPNASVNITRVVENLAAIPAKINNTRAGIGKVLDIDGQAIDLNSGVKVLVFFYTKCPGCKVLLTGLKNMEDIDNVSIVLISPSIYDSASTLREFRGEWVSTWYYVLDENTVLTKTFNVTNFPTVILLENGVVKFAGIGARGEAEWMAGELSNLLEGLFEVTGDPAALSALAGLLMLVVIGIDQRREFKEEITE